MLDTTRLSAFWYYAAAPVTLLSVLALIVLWIWWRSVLDLWLMVVMCAYVVEISFPRFSFGWYVGRVFGLLSSSLVLSCCTRLRSFTVSCSAQYRSNGARA